MQTITDAASGTENLARKSFFSDPMRFAPFKLSTTMRSMRNTAPAIIAHIQIHKNLDVGTIYSWHERIL